MLPTPRNARLTVVRICVAESAVYVELHRISSNQHFTRIINYCDLKLVQNVIFSGALPFVGRDVKLQRVTQFGQRCPVQGYPDGIAALQRRGKSEADLELTSIGMHGALVLR